MLCRSEAAIYETVTIATRARLDMEAWTGADHERAGKRPLDGHDESPTANGKKHRHRGSQVDVVT